MIIRIEPLGKSFKGVGAYLTHDLKMAQTAERVDWTHTLNLASDLVGEAINEMYWTFRASDQLKREAGLKAGGRAVEKPVKHFSLNWHPSEKPNREEMISAVTDFMAHMGWSDRQAVLVAHRDRPHSHVHVILNTVSPINGRTLDPGYEHARASTWGLGYEQERFGVLCAQRLKPYEQREPAPTREAWLKLKEAEKEFDRAEDDRAAKAPDYLDRHEAVQWKAKEWQALRGYQKDQRTAFFDGGKKAYRDARNAVFREVRTEFRDEWNTWFRLRKEGCDLNLLGEIKKGILERQNAELEKRRDAACKDLRADRDTEYAGILKEHREERAQLRQRQHDGLRSYELLDHQHNAKGGLAPASHNALSEHYSKTKGQFGKAAEETTKSRDTHEKPTEHEEPREAPVFEPGGTRNGVKHPLEPASLLPLAGLGALTTLAERLFDGFLGGGTPARPPQRTKRHLRPSNDNPQARATEGKSRAEQSEAEEAARLQAAWEERRRRTRSRD